MYRFVIRSTWLLTISICLSWKCLLRNRVNSNIEKQCGSFVTHNSIIQIRQIAHKMSLTFVCLWGSIVRVLERYTSVQLAIAWWRTAWSRGTRKRRWRAGAWWKGTIGSGWPRQRTVVCRRRFRFSDVRPPRLLRTPPWLSLSRSLRINDPRLPT